MNSELVRGFKDYTEDEAEKKEELKKILSETFEKYGFEPAETPIIEYEDFVRGLSQEEDEAVSDIFKLQDKGKRNLALRYEFTFQLKRISKNKKLPYKRYQIGEVFRDEPSSEMKKRLRQFTQCDVDVVGTSDIIARDEVEILAIVNEIFEKLRIKPIILVNNRKLLNEILDELKIKKNREQVLREIDKYDKLPEKIILENLKKFNADSLIKVLKKGEDYFKKFESYREIISLIEYCKIYGIKILFSPTIVRGLSYYNGNVFEIKSEGIKETLVAGGSYLINEIQSTGISFGLERLILASKLKSETEKIMIVSLEQDKEAIKIAQKLRKNNEKTIIYYGKPSKALQYADAKKISKVIFVGEKEVKSKKFKIRDMKSGKETLKKFN